MAFKRLLHSVETDPQSILVGPKLTMLKIERTFSYRFFSLSSKGWLTVTGPEGKTRYAIIPEEANYPYDTVSTPQFGNVSVSDLAWLPGRIIRASVLVDNKPRYVIHNKSRLSSGIAYEICGMDGTSLYHLRQRDREKWWKYPVIASDCGALQFKLSGTVIFDETVPLDLAMGLEIFIIFRFRSSD